MIVDRSLKRGRSQVGSLVDGASSITSGTPISFSSHSLSYSSYRPSSYQSPSSCSSSYLGKFQHNFMKDFTCCGSLVPTLHDLLQHYEEMHAQSQGSSGAPAKTVQDETPSMSEDELLEFLEKEQAQFPESFGTTTKIAETSFVLPPLKRILGADEMSLLRSSQLSLMESIQPELDPDPDSLPHTATEVIKINMRDSEKGRLSFESVEEIKDAFEELNPFSLPHDEKPLKCPVVGCEKAYKNPNGLKHHKYRGHLHQVFQENEDGTYSVISTNNGELNHGLEKEKLHKCEVCGKRYKNANGLRYHKQLSTRCNSNPETLAPASPVGKPNLAVEPQVPPKSHIEPTSNSATPQPVVSSSTNKKQKLATGPVFQCLMCDKTFTRAAGLSEHRLRHADERPFTCSAEEGCDQKFFSLKDRKRHEAIHSGEKNFICEAVALDGSKIGCGREFGRADHLAAHRRTDAGRACVLEKDEKFDSIKLMKTLSSLFQRCGRN